MNDSQFHHLADQLFLFLEDTFEDGEDDIECEASGNVLTLEFENRSQIVINRQEPLHEIWVASKSGGYHFKYHQEKHVWLCTRSGAELMTLLKKECEVQSGKALNWA
jgi:CyaY protein